VGLVGAFELLFVEPYPDGRGLAKREVLFGQPIDLGRLAAVLVEKVLSFLALALTFRVGMVRESRRTPNIRGRQKGHHGNLVHPS
jgi:hypothetical protein